MWVKVSCFSGHVCNICNFDSLCLWLVLNEDHFIGDYSGGMLDSVHYQFCLVSSTLTLSLVLLPGFLLVRVYLAPGLRNWPYLLKQKGMQLPKYHWQHETKRKKKVCWGTSAVTGYLFILGSEARAIQLVNSHHDSHHVFTVHDRDGEDILRHVLGQLIHKAAEVCALGGERRGRVDNSLYLIIIAFSLHFSKLPELLWWTLWWYP